MSLSPKRGDRPSLPHHLPVPVHHRAGPATTLARRERSAADAYDEWAANLPGPSYDSSPLWDIPVDQLGIRLGRGE